MSVLLMRPFFQTVSNRELVTQLEARKKAEKKLPTWFYTANIYFANKLNIEQTSSEITAQHKARLVQGKTLVDLTGGFGIDSYFFSKKIERVYHCEISKELSEIASHNFTFLGVKNIITVPEDGITFLRSQQQHFDWLYIDPSRRNEYKGKVFQLADCIPNVSQHLNLFFKKSDNILLKTSPLLDISKGISELKDVFQIHIVAVNNEVKELLWVLKEGVNEPIEVKTLNLKKSIIQKFDFSFSDENRAVSDFSLPLTYIYEPNAAIMKSGGFKLIGHTFALKKLHRNTHLYTSNRLVNFPGRRFKIKAKYPYHIKTIKKLGIKKANVAIRNFPKTVAIIRKHLQIKDGGEIFLFFVTDMKDELTLLHCTKV